MKLVFVVLSTLALLSVAFCPVLANTLFPGAASLSDCRMAWAYVDKAGKLAFPAKPYFGCDFSEGLAWGCEESETMPRKFLVIDRKGCVKFRLDCDWREADFHNGLSLIHRDGGYGYVGTDGKIAIPCTFKAAKPFVNGRAEVVAAGPDWERLEIDKHGKVLGKIAKVEADGSFFPWTKWVDDGSGRPLFVTGPAELDHFRPSHFSDGLAWVYYKSSYPDSQLGYIDSSKHLVFTLDPSVEAAGDFHEGLAPVIVKSNDVDAISERVVSRLGFVDTAGRMVIAPKFSDLHPDRVRFSEGIARVSLDGYDCYIDRRGRVLFRFLLGHDFHDGLAAVRVVLDSRGKLVDAADLSHGYQNREAFRTAVLTIIQSRAASFPSPARFDFSLRVDAGNKLVVKLLRPSGTPSVDERVLASLNEITVPRLGVALADGVGLGDFRIQDGKLTVCSMSGREQRHAKTQPTLPEGWPIPDNE